MKKTLFYLLLIALGAACVVSCSKDRTCNGVDDLERRVAALEEWSRRANDNIAALQAIVDAIKSQNQIVSVTPVTSGGKEVGYTITFTQTPPITIYHGKDGESPVVKAKLDTDGSYYWVVVKSDGSQEYILDGSGNKVASAPRLRISSATSEWELSTDGGATWQTTGVKATGTQGPTGATGPAGDNLFSSVDHTSSADRVTVTLTDGSTFEVPKYIELAFSLPASTPFTDGEARTLTYTLTGTATAIEVISLPQGWFVSIDTGSGIIKVSAPLNFIGSAGELVVQASNGNKSVVARYTLTPKVGTIFYHLDRSNDMGVVIRPKTLNEPGLVMIRSIGTIQWSQGIHPLLASSMTDGMLNSAEVNNYVNTNNLMFFITFPAIYQSTQIDGYYLPAASELAAYLAGLDPAYHSRLSINPTDSYWASTEVDANNAYYCNYDGTVVATALKNTLYRCIPVKRF